MKRTFKILPLATALALGAGPAFGLGLGAIEVKSRLNQPLVAEIPLLGVAPGELDALSVRLASPDAFQRVGLPAPAGTTANLQFSVGRNARGEPVVRVTTTGRVDDPFVSFLLQAEWERGSLVREFTVLIDPPHIAAATVQPMAAPTVAAAPAKLPPPVAPPPVPQPPEPPQPVAPPPAQQPAEPQPAEPPQPVAPPPPPEPPQPVAPPPPMPAIPGARVVRAGETLWGIASDTRDGATVAQMMLAIQRANPDAFIRDNINLLRSGAVLRIPAPDDTGPGRAEAEAQVGQQMAAWRALSPGSAPAPVPVPGEAPRAVGAPPPRGTVAEAPAAGPRLEIAPPIGAGRAAAQSGAAGDDAGAELRAELQEAREDLSARDVELAELRSRLAEQEELANEQQRLIALKDSQLSALEESLRQQWEEERAAATAPAPMPQPVAPAPPAATAGAATDANAVPTAAVPTAAVPWWQGPLVWGAAALLLVGGVVALLRRRRPAAAARTPIAAGTAGSGASKLSEDPEFLASLPQNAGSRVDDAAESENFEKFEELEQPEQKPPTVPETLAVEPPTAPYDLERELALLRRLYNAGDADAFLGAAETMREHIDDSADPRWREVVVMGMGLAPGHTLFREVRWNPVNADDVVTRPPAPGKVVEEAPVVEPSAPADLDDTKLELAKAYIEIGDADGARGMLNEVLAEGSPAARAEAERLLRELG